MTARTLNGGSGGTHRLPLAALGVIRCPAGEPSRLGRLSRLARICDLSRLLRLLGLLIGGDLVLAWRRVAVDLPRLGARTVRGTGLAEPTTTIAGVRLLVLLVMSAKRARAAILTREIPIHLLRRWILLGRRACMRQSVPALGRFPGISRPTGDTVLIVVAGSSARAREVIGANAFGCACHAGAAPGDAATFAFVLARTSHGAAGGGSAASCGFA